ncbi:peptidylprolyl isomerase [Pseudaquidulcibacter saccharophilus]|uniref:peptidylprolyl isomerase n=1 Tax=Pseudaquidulcibacter saccharophilus TaxID=2831900 RepID=UPI001EFF35EE|nr:peptidylprolyl isomerase [Pseudaquidulcibacter saccharophilus]
MKQNLNKTIFKGVLAAILIAGFANVSFKNAYAQDVTLNEGVAAIVNDEPITSFDLRQRTRFILITAGVASPSQDAIIAASQQALNSLINEKLQIQEAKKYKLTMSDAEVDRILTNQAKQNGATLDQFFNELRQAGISIQSYRDKTRAEVLWQRIVSGRYSSRVKITKEQLDDALARIQASAYKPQYQVSEIFIEVASPDEDERARLGSNTLVEQIRNGASFGRVAQQFSFSPSAATGGDLGWVVQGELRPEVAKIVDTIPVGQVSDPIPVQGGYMIVAVRNKRSGGNVSLNLDLRQLVVAENNKKGAKAIDDVRNQFKGCDSLKKLADKNGVTVNELGKVALNDLSDEYKNLVENLPEGKVSNSIQSGANTEALVVCNREVTGEDIPTAQQLEDSMFDQELSLIARRYLRDLRREAAIVTR